MKLKLPYFAITLWVAALFSAQIRAQSALWVYQETAPTITKTLTSPVTATYTYRASFVLDLTASGDSCTLGWPNANIPAIPPDAVTVYKNGQPDPTRTLTVTYIPPPQSIGLLMLVFTIPANSTVRMPVTVEFTVTNPGNDNYGVMLNAIYSYKAGGVKQTTSLGGYPWFVGFGPTPHGRIDWVLDPASAHRRPILANYGLQEVTTYHLVNKTTIPAVLNYVQVAYTGLFSVYADIEGVTDLRLWATDGSVFFYFPQVTIPPGGEVLVQIRGEPDPSADSAIASLASWSGDTGSIPGIAAKRPIVDEIPNDGAINMSVRTVISPNQYTAAGLVVTGHDKNQRYPILLRLVGPSLGYLGVTDPLSRPQIEVYDHNNVKQASNSGWSSDLESAFLSAGAFSLPRGSADAAVLLDLLPGTYNVNIKGLGNGTGTALFEAYRLPFATTSASVGTKG